MLYHLYMTARGNLDKVVPKEIRILKHILTLEDPAEQMSALEDAFSPGESSRGAGGGVNGDSLYTYDLLLISLIVCHSLILYK